MQLTTFDDLYAKTKTLRNVTLTELAEGIRRAKAPTKKKLRLLKLGVFGDDVSKEGSYRTDANMLYVTGVEGDYDGGKVSFETAVGIAEKAKLKCIVHTTASHTSSEPRWRVLVPFSKNLTPANASNTANTSTIFLAAFCAGIHTLSRPCITAALMATRLTAFARCRANSFHDTAQSKTDQGQGAKSRG